MHLCDDIVVAARVAGPQKVAGTLHSENTWSEGIDVIYWNDRNRELFEERTSVSEEREAVTAGGSRAISRVEILLRGEHFPLENFIHSVNIGVLITKTPRILATSFSPPGGKKVSLHTYWGPMTLAHTIRPFFGCSGGLDPRGLVGRSLHRVVLPRVSKR